MLGAAPASLDQLWTAGLRADAELRRTHARMLAQVVRRLFRSEHADDNQERDDKPDPEHDAHQNGD
jgi:hypothetical protein